MTITRREAFYGRLFRRTVASVRAVRPHHWPVVGTHVARLAERVMSSTHPDVVWFEAHELHLDPNDDLGLARGRPYEPLLRQMMERYIPPGGTVVDGGAHIGYHTLLAARLVGPSGRVISFEPAPATYALLAENVERNGYENVTLVNGALSDRSGRGTLLLNSSWSGDHRIGDVQNGQTIQKTANGETIPIDLHSLDELLGEEESVDFIKLDVQGAEPLVFRGAKAVLENNPELVVATEYDPVALPRSLDEEAFLNELFSRFTTVLDVNDETKSICSATLPALLASYTRENERHTNLVCVNRVKGPKPDAVRRGISQSGLVTPGIQIASASRS